MNKNLIKLLFIGNILEYYDFAIYGVFSITMAPDFFPAVDKFSQILLTLAVFASGFFARPFGGLIFGYIGDKLGRKVALMSSIAGMALATFLIGMLPIYASLGIAAPVLLVSLRLVQGICLGGEGTGMAVFILEHLYQYKQGFINGLVSASGIAGTLLATSIGFVLHKLSMPTEITWRLAFIIGGLLGTLTLIMRSKLVETPLFINAQRTTSKPAVPIIELITISPAKLVLGICMSGLIGAMCYSVLVYNNILFTRHLGFSAEQSLLLTSTGTLCLIVCMPIIGMLADKYSYKKILGIACILTILLAKLCFACMLSTKISLIIAGLLCFAILSAGIAAPAYQFLFNLFNTSQRYSGMAFCFNVGTALFGSTAPLISTYFTKTTGSIYSAAYYLVCISIVCLLALSMDFRNSSKRSLAA